MSITSIHASYKYTVLQKERWSKALGNLLRRSHVHCVGVIGGDWFRQTVRNCMYLKTPVAAVTQLVLRPSPSPSPSTTLKSDFRRLRLSNLTAHAFSIFHRLCRDRSTILHSILQIVHTMPNKDWMSNVIHTFIDLILITLSLLLCVTVFNAASTKFRTSCPSTSFCFKRQLSESPK